MLPRARLPSRQSRRRSRRCAARRQRSDAARRPRLRPRAGARAAGPAREVLPARALRSPRFRALHRARARAVTTGRWRCGRLRLGGRRPIVRQRFRLRERFTLGKRCRCWSGCAVGHDFGSRLGRRDHRRLRSRAIRDRQLRKPHDIDYPRPLALGRVERNSGRAGDHERVQRERPRARGDQCFLPVARARHAGSQRGDECGSGGLRRHRCCAVPG